MGNTNRKFVLGMLLAGLNRYIERSWRAKQAANESSAPKPRAKRRTGTLAEVLKSSASTAASGATTAKGGPATSQPRPSPKAPART